MARRATALALLAAAVFAVAAQVARADGDPGSDVLVYQNLFVGSDAGFSVAQQAQLGNMLQAADRAGFPIRVAVIASSSDLGAVTGLWRRPRAYARFLGVELSLAYKQRLLVVMPNGFGFNWPGHPTASAYALLARTPISGGAQGLFAATQTAVRTLAGATGVRLGSSSQSPQPKQAAVPSAHASTSASARSGTDGLIGTVVIALVALAALGLGARAALRRGRFTLPGLRDLAAGAFRHPATPRRWVMAILGISLVVAVAVPIAVLGGSGASQAQALATNPHLDPGTPLSGTAPGFTLSDQFGQPVSLHSFRGKVVLLAFTDSECTTICPMTTAAMLDAQAMLGRAGSRVQLLGVDANPASTSLEDVWSYSELHGMLHRWQFLTGSLTQLRRVWKSYAVEADIEHGLIAHTPALFVIGPRGQEAKVYLTQQSYAAVGQLGQIVAHEASSLLPGHPAVHSDLSYAPIPTISPTATTKLPRAGGGTVRLGPGSSAHLYMFFATWDQETTSLAGHLAGLDRYAAAAAGARLPALTAVDEASLEPSREALPGFLHQLPRPLSYPVAIDRSGRVADGYEVEGVPWFVLVSPSGKILWYWEVSTAGWPSLSTLIRDVRAGLTYEPAAPENAAVVRRELAGSPPTLAALHAQAGLLLGSQRDLLARVHELRGYPLVINVWGSWCAPCVAEFGLFASASARYGRQVAFLGADVGDSPADGQSFLAQHPVSYPSYPTSTTGLDSIVPQGLEGTPTTLFLSRAGKLVYVHTGQYESQGTLDSDIRSYALSG